MSKGSKPRKYDVKKFNKNYDKIFRRGKEVLIWFDEVAEIDPLVWEELGNKIKKREN